MTTRISFQSRITLVMVVLLMVVIVAVILSVKIVTNDAVRSQATSQIELGSRVFERLLDERGKRLRDAVSLLAADFGFRDAVSSGDSATIRSALINHGNRISADDMFLLGMDGSLIASNDDTAQLGSHFAYDQALREARRRQQPMLVIPLRGEPHLLVEASVLAPLPIGRVVMGFAMDAEMASELQSLTNLDVSFLTVENGQTGQLISTLPGNEQAAAAAWLQAYAGDSDVHQSEQDGHQYLSQVLGLADNNGPARVYALLQSPLDAALHAFSGLDRSVFYIAMSAFAASLLAALLLARSMSRPLQALAAAAERIGAGDYQVSISETRQDEVGQLARTIILMQRGIAEREQQLSHNALHDSRTGLPNRTLALERIGSAIAAQRSVAVLHLGIDNLKLISQSGGPALVDQLLRLLGQRLQGILRPGDSVAHLVSDEFLLLLDGLDVENAVASADRLQHMLLKPQKVGGHDVALDCRIGIAGYPRDASNADELMTRAAIALKDAAGMPGRLQVYETGRDIAHERQIQLIRDLRRAAANSELMLNYQPKMEIRTGKVYQAEALLRWKHPTFGMVSPGEFIVLAEHTGSIQLLTRWVIEEGIRQLGEWNRSGLRLQVSLNICADDLLGADLTGEVRSLLETHQVPADQLIFEITESAVMREPEQALKVLNALRELGVLLSVDDFGTGYSSLAHLKRLPVQEVKIDQSFVRELDETSEDAVIVRSTIEMSHNLGLKVVAEGVEYEHCLRLLKRWHCDTAQGYFISRPLPAEAFTAWILEHQAKSAAAGQNSMIL